MNSSQKDVFFGSDSWRVLQDWTKFDFNHYRTKVHPLYVLLIFPFTIILKYLFNSGEVACALFTAVMSVLNVFLMDRLLQKITKPTAKINFLRALFVLLYATLFVVFINAIIIESFLTGVVTLLLFWNYFVSIKNKELTTKNYVMLVVLGVLCFAIVATNIVHFAIGLLFLLVFNRKKSFKQFALDVGKFVALMLIVVGVAALLGFFQSAIFKTTNNGVGYSFRMIFSLFTKSSNVEDVNYIEPYSFQNLVRSFTATFSNSFIGAGLVSSQTQIYFNNLTIINYAQMLIVFALLIYCLILLIKNKKFVFALPFICTFAFEFVFHLFYGNREIMLYELQIIYLLIVILFVGLSSDKKRGIYFSLVGLISIIILDLSFNCYALVKIYNTLEVFYMNFWFNFGKTMTLVLTQIGVVFVAILLVILIIRHFRRYNSKLGNVIFLALCFVECACVLALQCVIPISFLTINKESVYNDKYPIVMGMGLRKKFLIEKQSVGNKFNLFEYNLDSKKKILLIDNMNLEDFNAQEYTASLSKDGNKITIYENESGIFVDCNGEIVALDDSVKINIPNFDNYEYSNYLKILFHETMVNITKNGPTPSFLFYGNIWYRDGAIMAMVAEKTNNVLQLEPWLNSLDETAIYDHAREQTNNIQEGIEEADNLGELLYMLSLINNPNQKIINAIIAEANKLKVVGKQYIQGITDFALKPAYQTKWLLFGLNKLGLGDMGFSLGDATDDYSDLCWFYNREQKQNFKGDFESLSLNLFVPAKQPYPYLSWAKLHYYNMKIEIPNNLIYPISYEGNFRSHGWTAAEMFLYLLNYSQFE